MGISIAAANFTGLPILKYLDDEAVERAKACVVSDFSIRNVMLTTKLDEEAVL